jgi:hypothetical protein
VFAGVWVFVRVCCGVDDCFALAVLVIVSDRLILDVIVVVLDCAGLAETVLEADTDPDTDTVTDTFEDFVGVLDITGELVLFSDPVPETETVEVLLDVTVLVLVGVTRGLGELDDEAVSVLDPLEEAECVDDTVEVLVPAIDFVEHAEAVLVFVDVTDAVLVGVL